MIKEIVLNGKTISRAQGKVAVKKDAPQKVEEKQGVE
jgi:hypothetical protein